MFHLDSYSSKIQSILRPHEAGWRLMPLAPRSPLQGEGARPAREHARRRVVRRSADHPHPTSPNAFAALCSFTFLISSAPTRSPKKFPRPPAATGTASCTARNPTSATRNTGSAKFPITRSFRRFEQRPWSNGQSPTKKARSFCKMPHRADLSGTPSGSSTNARPSGSVTLPSLRLPSRQPSVSSGRSCSITAAKRLLQPTEPHPDHEWADSVNEAEGIDTMLRLLLMTHPAPEQMST